MSVRYGTIEITAVVVVVVVVVVLCNWRYDQARFCVDAFMRHRIIFIHSFLLVG